MLHQRSSTVCVISVEKTYTGAKVQKHWFLRFILMFLFIFFSGVRIWVLLDKRWNGCHLAN